MIIKPKTAKPIVTAESKSADKKRIMVFMLSLGAALLLLAWLFKDSGEVTPVSDVTKITGDNAATLKVVPAAGQQSVTDPVVGSPDRQTLAEKNNVIERDAFKIGEEQARHLRVKLETKQDISVQERSNLIQTVQQLESGQLILQ